MDFFKIEIRFVIYFLNNYNIEIKENCGFSERIGFWWLRFIFDYVFEKDIELCLINFKYGSRSEIWMLEVIKCNYLGIICKEEMDLFDMEDEFVNWNEFC